MKVQPNHESRRSRLHRRLTITALVLTTVALLLCLQFVFNTTGGTLFLFSTIAPLLVLGATALVVGVLVSEYLQKNKLFVIERYPAGEVIFRQGEDGDSAYFVREGEVEVIDERDGSVLAQLGTGDYFGEMALLGNTQRNATVRTASAVELAALGKRNFLNMMKLLPATEQAILNTVRERAMHWDGGRQRSDPC